MTVLDTDRPLGVGGDVRLVRDEHDRHAHNRVRFISGFRLRGDGEEMLAGLGYEPVGFESSQVALQAFRSKPERFDLVLTDEAMPELMGTELAREIRLLRAELPIILMSGHGGAPLEQRAAVIGVKEVLHKPLRRVDLAESLARALVR